MRKEFLEAGRVVGTHGIKGELRLEPWCDSAAFLKGVHTLYWDKDGRQPVKVLHSRPHKSFLLLTLEGDFVGHRRRHPARARAVF